MSVLLRSFDYCTSKQATQTQCNWSVQPRGFDCEKSVGRMSKAHNMFAV